MSIETWVGQNRKPKSSGEVSSEFDNSLEKIGVTVKSEKRESNLEKFAALSPLKELRVEEKEG